MILMSQNTMLSSSTSSDGVAQRIAQQTLAKRGAGYVDEVRRLLDAALAVMRSAGPDGRARVADIVVAAGLSNDAFYRHFPSKDALVAAVIEDGSERLQSYLTHQMAKETTPDGRIRRWVEGVLSQARGDVAETTLAVMVNAGGATTHGLRQYPSSAVLATPLVDPLTELGSTTPELDAAFVADGVIGRLNHLLWERTAPSRAELARCVDLALCVAGTGPARRQPGR
jgi:AcrR family transcriptional regulator